MYTVGLFISTSSLCVVATHDTKDSLFGVCHLTQIPRHQSHRRSQSCPRSFIRLDDIDHLSLHPILFIDPVLPLRTGLAPLGRLHPLLLQLCLFNDIILVLLLFRCRLQPVLLHLFLGHLFSSSPSSLCFLCRCSLLCFFFFLLLFYFCDCGSSSFRFALLSASDGSVDVLTSAPAFEDRLTLQSFRSRSANFSANSFSFRSCCNTSPCNSSAISSSSLDNLSCSPCVAALRALCLIADSCARRSLADFRPSL